MSTLSIVVFTKAHEFVMDGEDNPLNYETKTDTIIRLLWQTIPYNLVEV